MPSSNDAPLWNDAPESVEHFTRLILAQARAAGVIVRIAPGVNIAYPNAQAIECSGYFCADPLQQRPPELGVAMGGPWQDAFPVFVHEFAHLTQWRDRAPEWAAVFDKEGVEAADRIDAWLTGTIFSADEIKATFRAARAVEMDAEKRVVAMIQDHDLPLDVIEYIQRANAYVLYYHHVEATHRWRGPDELAPYRDPQVWPHAPSKLGDPEFLPGPLSEALGKAYGAWPLTSEVSSRRRPSM